MNISNKQEVKFGLTSKTARNYIFLQTLIKSKCEPDEKGSYFPSEILFFRLAIEYGAIRYRLDNI